MSTTIFSTLIRKHFQFLEDEFGFVVKEVPSQSELSDAELVYQSRSTVLRIGKNRDGIFLFIKPAGEPDVAEISLDMVLGYSSVNEYVPGIVIAQEYDNALGMLASLLKKHCQAFIKGDFSNWEDVIEYFVVSTKERYRFNTGQEMPSRVFRKQEAYIKKIRKYGLKQALHSHLHP